MIIQGLSANISDPPKFNERWQENIALYWFWTVQLLESYGVNMAMNVRADFEDRDNDLLPAVHLSKLITSVQRYSVTGHPLPDDAPHQKYESVVATFDNALTLEYDPKAEAFTVGGFTLDLEKAKTEQEARNAIADMVQGAFILTQVNKAKISANQDNHIEGNPLEIYALQMVGQALNVRYSSPSVDVLSLPALKALEIKDDEDPRVVLAEMINGCIEKMADDPLMGINRPVKNKPAPIIKPPEEQTDEAPSHTFDPSAFATSFAQPQ